MLDRNKLRNNLDFFKKKLVERGVSESQFEAYVQADKAMRKLLHQIELANQKQTLLAQQVAKKKGDPKLLKESKELKQKLEQLNIAFKEAETLSQELLLNLPNIADESVPVGRDETANLELLKEGRKPVFDFTPLPHWELCERLQLVAFDKATKLTGARFVAYTDKAAKLLRAIASLMIDLNKNKYQEWNVPVIVNETSLTGTGQLPKFKDDVFKLENTRYYLSPTLEVQLANLHANEIFTEGELPKYYTATGVNFRQEAGSAGKQTKGTIRLHQFQKVELVKFCKPSEAIHELEEMTRDAEQILLELKIPFRRLLLCSGDMGFSAQKTYDLEVWMAGCNEYREVSSCSSCGDFQARRAMIRYKDLTTGKNTYVATLNGTALAIDRIFAAILEHYQTKAGEVMIPQALLKYLDFDKITKPK
ncbi:serine--tRNA ligase [Mycoplasmoides pneumoniae]|uniref:Serine--tRNA ligase n=1 Tax=Mycoplasma pneumoniae (strain ATCC 29342 / M129 / Subtype 1) TaxID=272634 RepID=SYS_MYCPN|nr:serine--tRNA ligase [Mycoplasmoides pneumoniae]P75107.1 RecName: Full=Serine--tRNA ligase; AltName: Full=Seryl-tRNA synthetase; Short=SerRS; AltName: Full=Seryl-tRNA(Ser/Sec) synthetase [Mycoplasmoides pneumoniae M129]AAB95797.1 seryl-tRNA synthetase [Mycoplasmoides pneumoniae M129]AGC03949.1 seryl-tRNA synthetase [Mycoplasmoides pneumoniae M129-B7]ALA29881.1 seryl-tRNA synthetase [Mycoplasmoides pneumoniae PI 1428]ALA31996.1 seryl-tRNA synthetase [Mycoplasmoides pneumoniae 51494]ALA32699.